MVQVCEVSLEALNPSKCEIRKIVASCNRIDSAGWSTNVSPRYYQD